MSRPATLANNICDRWRGLLWICALLAVGGCTDDAPTHLSSRQQEVMDSLLTMQIPMVKQEEDSLCQAYFDRRLRHLVDSLLRDRREEEARLRKMIPVR